VLCAGALLGTVVVMVNVGMSGTEIDPPPRLPFHP
jgi:hypothetical protein